MNDANASTTLEHDISALLNELSVTQNELLDVLGEKRQHMAKSDITAMKAAEERERELTVRLEEFQTRRQTLLASAQQQGRAGDTLGELAKSFESPTSQRIAASTRVTASRMRLLQNECLTNWVLAQRSLLHLSQILEIIATGGKKTPTYSNGTGSHISGGLLDQEA